MAVVVVSLVWPGVVGALWVAMRRREYPPAMAPALFAVTALSALLMVPAANEQSVPAFCALALALTASLWALIEFTARTNPPRSPGDDEDEGPSGGGGDWHRPGPPRTGPGDEPAWWPVFEQAFWADVSARAPRASSGDERVRGNASVARRLGHAA